MHALTVTTCTPDGHLITVTHDSSCGTLAEAVQQAAHIAARHSIDVHAADPHLAHVHLIETNGQPVGVVPHRTTPTGRTDLLATLRGLARRA